MDQIDGARLTQQQVMILLNSADPTLKQAAAQIVSKRQGWSKHTIAVLQRWSASDGQDAADALVARAAVVSFSDNEQVQEIVQSALMSPVTSSRVRQVLLEAIGRLQKWPVVWVPGLASLLRHEDGSVAL